MALKIDKLMKSANVAELLSKDELSRIGQKVVNHFELDEESREEWSERVEQAMKIAKQTVEQKNNPFPKASNVKYPLITQAAIDFAARTYPEIIQNDQVVKVNVVGDDPTGEKHDRAARVGHHMSFQLLHNMEHFEDDVDRLLHILPILGTVFKKTYYDANEGKVMSELCHPENIVVNYNVESLESARRISHVLLMHKNDIIERVRGGEYLKDIVEKLHSPDDDGRDDDAPFEIIEQHCYLDLDDDGYQEPYIVLVHRDSCQVMKIINRFDAIHFTEDRKTILKIEPIHYFTDYHFIRSPDGGFYSTGLGTLLYPLNEAINTLINQLIDAGTLNNMQSGFIGRGLRLKNGEFRLRLGEWKVLEAAAGTNIAQNVFPLPTKEPSPTLFQLLGLLIDIGKDLSASHDVMQGKGQTQNVAATTVLAMVQQGMKVFNSITKRLYRSLRKEFGKIFMLNREYLTDAEYQIIVDNPMASVERDYDIMSMDVIPVADPGMASDAQRMAKAQAILAAPGVDPRAAAIEYLRALQLSPQQIEALLPAPDPNAPPPPEVLKVLAEIDNLKAQAERNEAEALALSAKASLDDSKLEIQRDAEIVRAQESAARIMKMKQDAMVNENKIELAGAKADHAAKMKELDLLHKSEKDEVDLQIRAAEVAKDLREDKTED